MERLRKLMAALKARGYTGKADAQAVEAWSRKNGHNFTWPVADNDPEDLRSHALENGEVPIVRMMEYLLTVEDDGSISVEPVSMADDSEAEDPIETSGMDERSALNEAARLRAERKLATERSLRKISRATIPASEHNTRAWLRGASSQEIREARTYDLQARQGRATDGKLATAFSNADYAAYLGAKVRSETLKPSQYETPALAKRDQQIVEHFRALGSVEPGKGGDWNVDDVSGDLSDLRVEVSILGKFLTIRSTPSLKGARPSASGDMTAYWAAENPSSDLTDSEPGTDLINFSLEELIGLTYAPNTWLRSATAVDIGNWLGESHVRARESKLNDAFLNGDGGNQYGGIVGLGNALQAGSIKAASGNSWSAVTWPDITGTFGKTKQVAGLTEEIGICNKAFVHEVVIPVAAAQFNSGLQVSVAPDRATVNGYNFLFMPDMPGASASGSNVLYAGAFRAGVEFVELDNGIEIEEDRSVEFKKNRTAFRSVSVVDLIIHSVGDANSAGVIAALQTT
jgi:HK97 family phage major capsid protein